MGLLMTGLVLLIDADTLEILNEYVSQLGSCSTYAYLGPQWRNQYT
jgi:hypothetical protein